MRAFAFLPLLLGATTALVHRIDGISPDHRIPNDALGTTSRDVALIPSINHDKVDSSLNQAEASDLSLSLVDPSSSTALTVSPDGIVGALLLALRGRLFYFIAAKVSKVLVKAVMAMLEKAKIVNRDDKVTYDFIEASLTKITIVILTMLLVAKKNEEGGQQIVNLGADDGKEEKVRTQRFLLDHPVDTVSWDMSDDEAHATGNTFNDQRIIGEGLRTEMLAKGMRNVTFLHAGPEHDKTPVLAYHGEDNMIHYHWRPRQERPKSPKKRGKDTLFNKHYPFFDAHGAGFKISAQNPIDMRSSAVPHDDAAKAAAAIVKDFLKKRQAASYVGYEEQIEKNKWFGHKLCFIAEITRFHLDNEIHKCFDKLPN
ncbi:hypothetical protein ANO11243_066660 [Dothideomycetidae sp. 11243]|nr:hypothetical protein ANO11243_066660 [fungal sp. No.11243]